MTDFSIIPTKSVAVIIDVASLMPAKNSQSSIHYVRTALENQISLLDSADLAYIYDKNGELDFGKEISESISIISQWRHKKINVADAFEECVALLKECQPEGRGLFYITDNYKETNDAVVQTVLRSDAAKHIGCRYFIYGIGPAYSPSLFQLAEGIRVNYLTRHVADASDLETYISKDMENL